MSLRFVSGTDFMRSEANFEWVMPPFVAKGSNMMLYGRQGLGKSSLMMQLIHSLATGEPWMGFPIVRTGKVLYLGLDMADAETRAILERCDEAGMFTKENIILPRPPHGEDALEFNVFDDAALADLKAICDAEKPIAVVVDAIQDAFEVPIGNYDVNQIGRQVLRRFRSAIGDAVLIFLNHKRKGVAKFGASTEEDDDEDAYMGGTVWEAKVAASLMLGYSKKTGRKFLKVMKTRIAKSPTKVVFLESEEDGFYTVQMNAGQLLAMWPYCIPDEEERKHAIETCKSQMDVFRSVAALCGEKVDTVKKAYQRALTAGAQFEWAKKLKDVKS